MLFILFNCDFPFDQEKTKTNKKPKTKKTPPTKKPTKLKINNNNNKTTQKRKVKWCVT